MLHREGVDVKASKQVGGLHAVLFTSATPSDDLWVTVDIGEYGVGVTLSFETVRRLLPTLEALLVLGD